MSTEKTYFRPNKYIFVDFLRSKGICFLINLISAKLTSEIILAMMNAISLIALD